MPVCSQSNFFHAGAINFVSEQHPIHIRTTARLSESQPTLRRSTTAPLPSYMQNSPIILPNGARVK